MLHFTNRLSRLLYCQHADFLEILEFYQRSATLLQNVTALQVTADVLSSDFESPSSVHKGIKTRSMITGKAILKKQ